MEYRSETLKKGYGKRPLWQWIAIYIVIGGILYAGVYYFVIARKSVYGSNQSSPSSPSQQQMTYPGY
jgi:hypothetical protein